jgi:voltage-gated sodium channel
MMAAARNKLTQLVESKIFERLILIVILANTICLGLETLPAVANSTGILFSALNKVFIGIFVAEAALKLFAWHKQYFKDGWNIFDFCIIVLSLIPTGGVFSGIRILRILRILRSLRMISSIKPLRKVVQAILNSLPGIGWTGVLMALVYYIFTIMGINLYSSTAPEQFGGFPESFVTLFSLTTMEGWQDTVFPFTEANPLNWLYFLTFLILSSFILLNLVVGIVVDNIDTLSRQEEDEKKRNEPSEGLSAEIDKLRKQLDHVQRLLDDQKPGS